MQHFSCCSFLLVVITVVSITSDLFYIFFILTILCSVPRSVCFSLESCCCLNNVCGGLSLIHILCALISAALPRSVDYKNKWSQNMIFFFLLILRAHKQNTVFCELSSFRICIWQIVPGKAPPLFRLLQGRRGGEEGLTLFPAFAPLKSEGLYGRS